MDIIVRQKTESLAERDLRPYRLNITVVRLFFPAKDLWIAGILKSAAFVEKAWSMRLSRHLEFCHRVAEPPHEPGSCLFTPTDAPVKGSLVENDQPFRLIEPQIAAGTSDSVPVLVVYFKTVSGDDGVVILSHRPADVEAIRGLLGKSRPKV